MVLLDPELFRELNVEAQLWIWSFLRVRSFQTKWETQQRECCKRQNTVSTQKNEAPLTVIYLENEILNVSLTLTSAQCE